MATHPSARGQKPAEQAARPEGRNTIVTVYIAGAGGGVATTAWGPDYEATAGALSIEQALDATIDMGRVPLLWTYARPDANYTEVKFGFDEQIGAGKIGHVALAAEATISGEIFRDDDGVRWRINNESGAWGNMGGEVGKSEMLRAVAVFMTAYCGLRVTADKAYSSNAVKRFIQKQYR